MPIYKGKTRQISAAPFRDRVVHHALTEVPRADFEGSRHRRQLRCRGGERQLARNSLSAFHRTGRRAWGSGTARLIPTWA